MFRFLNRRPARVRLRAGLCALWAWSLPVLATSPAPPDTAAALAEAEALLHGGEAVAAEARYRRLIVHQPGLADAHEGLGRALEAQGRPAEAAAVFFRLGKGLLEAGDYRSAAAVLRRSVRLTPASAAAHAALGRALLLDQAFERGGHHLERAVELGDRSHPTRLFLASAHWENGRTGEAEAELRALAQESAALAPRHQLASLLLWQGRYDEAAALLERLAAAGPAVPSDVQLDLARALEGAARTDAAVAAYRRVLERQPDRQQVRYRLALLLHRSGHPQEAGREMAAFQRSYHQEQERLRREGLARARLARGWKLLQDGRPAEALERFSTLPESPETLRGAALARSALGLHAAAVSTLERAVILAPDQSDLRLLLAEERLALEGEEP